MYDVCVFSNLLIVSLSFSSFVVVGEFIYVNLTFQCSDTAVFLLVFFRCARSSG